MVRDLKNKVIFCAAGVLSGAAAHGQSTVSMTTARRSALFRTKQAAKRKLMSDDRTNR
jgi:hypothetical protein